MAYISKIKLLLCAVSCVTVFSPVNLHGGAHTANSDWAGPDFIVIGTQKGGSTSLYHYLVQHPKIKKASRKEVHFFDHYYPKSLDWYQAQFVAKDEKSDFLIGEATPIYMFHPLAAERISRFFPHVKLVVVLRDPVKRAFSQYKMNLRKGLETRSFEQAIAQEKAMIKTEKSKVVASGEHGYWSSKLARFSYISRSLYLEQLHQVMRYFSKEQLLVITSDDLMRDTEGTVNQVFRFLGLEEYTLPNYDLYYVAENNDIIISRDTQAQLSTYFKRKNKGLQDYLNNELGQRVTLSWH